MSGFRCVCRPPPTFGVNRLGHQTREGDRPGGVSRGADLTHDSCPLQCLLWTYSVTFPAGRIAYEEKVRNDDREGRYRSLSHPDMVKRGTNYVAGAGGRSFPSSVLLPSTLAVETVTDGGPRRSWGGGRGRGVAEYTRVGGCMNRDCPGGAQTETSDTETGGCTREVGDRCPSRSSWSRV